jgi:membrane-associated phospholipid phosphatase
MRLVTLSKKIALAARQLTLYECAGVIMIGTLSAIFFLESKRLHDVFGVGTSPWLWWDDLLAIYQFPLTFIFSGIFALMGCVYLGLKHSTSIPFIRTRNLVRILASFCLMMAVYKIITFYINVFNPFDRDLTLSQIDRFLFFGKLPSEWLAPFSNPLLTDIFFAAYMSWFAMIYVTLLLMWKHSPKAVDEYVTTTILAFYIGYIAYAIVPAIGPEFTVHYGNQLGSVINLLTIGQKNLPRDCFPSLHTGISIIMLVFIRRYKKNLFGVYLFITAMIIVSTQYLRVHYGIDVIAGAALGIGICQVAPLWVENWVHARHANQKTLSVGTRSNHAADSLSELA